MSARRRLDLALSIGALVASSACGEHAKTGAPPATAAPQSARDGESRIADLGTCVLESGERIEECRIGYRAFGRLDATRSNAVLFPTWFTGTSQNLVEPAKKLVDTDRFFLVLVDALGDGVSSSPSNSRTQPRLHFPRFSVRDMVETQHRLLREVLGLERLHAIVGISMGAMQTYEWSVSHPEVVGKAIPIVGSPQLTSHDLLLWSAELHALEGDATYAHGDYRGRPPMRAVQDIHWLMLSTPRHRAEETSPREFLEWLEQKETDVSFDWNDWHRQLEAMLGHDVARGRGGSLEQIAKRTKPGMLVVVAEQDHMVEPGPAKAFARAAGAELFVLAGPCGHSAPVCENDALRDRVRAFLAD